MGYLVMFLIIVLVRIHGNKSKANGTYQHLDEWGDPINKKIR